MNSKAVVILGLLAAVGVVGAVVVSRSNAPEKAEIGEGQRRGAFIPSLSSRANDVAKIVITRATQTLTIADTDGSWRVVEKGNYPAKIETVRALVVGLAELREIEPKTTRPEQFAKLGVQDPVAPQPGAADADVPQSSLVTLSDKDGKPITSIIIGNTKPGMSPEVYARRAGENQSWLLSGRVDLPREATGWMDAKFADIKRERVKSVSITHADGSSVVVSRAQQADPFVLQGIPAGKELKDAGAPESIGSVLGTLTFQDVAALSTLDPTAPTGDDKPGPSIEIRTFDGLVVTIKSVTHVGRTWWKLSAAADDAVLASLPPTQPAPADATKPDAPPTPDKPAAMTQEAIRAEIAKLNTAWAAHSFAPADWKVRTLNSTMAELVKDPAPPTPPQQPSEGLPPGIQLPPQG